MCFESIETSGELPFISAQSPSVGAPSVDRPGFQKRFRGPLGLGNRMTGWFGHFLVIDRPYCGFSQMNEEYIFLNPATEPNEPH